MKFKLLFFFTLFWLSYPSLAQTQTIPFGYILTPKGEIWIELDDRTPNHKKSFIQLAENGYWDSLTFNRVIPNFVAQGGCPDTPEGFTDSEYLLEPEFHPELTHTYGAIGAGRDDNPGKLSARCQFYIVQNRNGIPRLDQNYTIFGKVIKGMDVIDEIVNVARDQSDQPIMPITLKVEVKNLSPTQIKSLFPNRSNDQSN